MTGTVLITGGGSTVGTHLAHLLSAANIPVLFGSRSGKRIPSSFPSVKLSWDDPSTFSNPFDWASSKSNTTIKTVYLIAHMDGVDLSGTLIPFIDLAVEKGVKRFVYLSASSVDKEHNVAGMGSVPIYLVEKGLDRYILRPTWFIDNLIHTYGHGIREKGEIETVVPTRRIPFVAAEDIARAAFEGIVADENKVKEVIIIGPELLTYDEATTTSTILSKPITHKPISADEMIKFYSHALPPDVAHGLTQAELAIESAGTEERWASLSTEEQEKMGLKVFVGKTSVKEWVERNKGLF
ncbi:ergot alkaloid biosynthetic protein A [Coprinopsis cinerea okayama7|uniref:Ergot alkaloid biosynthetic protein A n=1 Tax=Coprinopsis cinerea (strain Okayama-7 / 130 / ATCC MYA-4618 / FGSC 9003) TaxID=240176 RepID=A8NQ34_COPC7|nr:ergot alkaloid biosynthetic protein A [Coprinopsis cinerea okayama7\|eukprot:XP_001835471.1 ergot alkaloid biosynthetic protein A [Coprinopsis cinerea okayama7\